MGGTHNDVTTLERNVYFLSQMLDLPSKTLIRFAGAQNLSLRVTLVWGVKCMDFHSKMHVSDLICHLQNGKVNILDERSKDFQKK